jgi:hypothetical protein
VTPAMLKSECSTKYRFMSSDEDYVFSESTTWPFKWAANLHANYLIRISGYNCVAIKIEKIKGNK